MIIKNSTLMIIQSKLFILFFFTLHKLGLQHRYHPGDISDVFSEIRSDKQADKRRKLLDQNCHRQFA